MIMLKEKDLADLEAQENRRINMYKIKDEIDLEKLKQFGFEKCNIFGTAYEKMYVKISYCVTKDRFLHKFRDMGYYTDELKMMNQDIKRLGIEKFVKKVDD
jgi:hypothetical protein